MENREKQVDVLNDLIRINNDRVRGYEKATENLKTNDPDLTSMFSNFQRESRENEQELRSAVNRLGGEPAADTTISGKIYRGWMDVKEKFGGDDRKSILESCEFGEDAAQQAYKSALEEAEELSPEIKEIITRQQRSLRGAHDQVRSLRDRAS